MNARPDSEAPNSQRLFFALWPDATLQRQLHATANAVASKIRQGRRTRWENLHLTLVFLGSVSAETRDCLERLADGIGTSPFELVLDQVSAPRRRGLLWLAPTQVPAPLHDLVAALRGVQTTCGLRPEERPFRAHITLMRDLKHCPAPMPVAPIVWPVTQFALMRSHIGSDGSRYQVLKNWNLQ